MIRRIVASAFAMGAGVLLLGTVLAQDAGAASSSSCIDANGSVADCALRPPSSDRAQADNSRGRSDGYITAEEESSMYRDLIDWIRDNGGVIDPRQEVRRERPGDPSSVRKVYATAEIPENTVLCNVPWKIILAPEDPEEDDLCETVRITRRELDRYRQGTSTFAPYMRVLDHLGQHVTLPEGWSAEGKQLLRKVLGRDLPPPAVGSHLAWYQEECGGDLADEAGVKAALLVIGHRSNGFFTPDGDEKSQEVMMPFFDLYSHRDGKYYNTMQTQMDVGQNIEIRAARTIKEGEPIHGSVGFGDLPIGTPRILYDFGFVEEYPRQFSLQLVDNESHTHLITFSVEEVEGALQTDDRRLDVKWPEGMPPPTKGLQTLRAELVRLEALREIFQPNATDLVGVPTHERDIAAQYYAAFLEGVQYAVVAGAAANGRWARSHYTITDFQVAGVNLGSYLLDDDEEDEKPVKSDEPPFELFEDFDISHLIEGNEGWLDLLAYRSKLKRPSLSFYVDKVARKRWLPTQGYDQPNLYALHYAEELTETGDVEEESDVIYRLLPNNDFAAKPTHFSEGNGVYLVSRDPKTGEYMHSQTVTELLPLEEGEKFDNRVVATGLAYSLHGKTKPYESWALKNVKPGFVVEERFVQFDRWDRPPMELCIFVIWGRVWVGQMNYIEGQGRYHGAFIYRNGTTAKGSMYKKIPFDWLDWPRLVELAEKLGANKDMFRADFFVGLPSGAPSARNGTNEEKLRDLRVVVSESEIYPTTVFISDALPADAARLWVAGYKKGNYKIIPNTEVPKEFLETGKISIPDQK